ncbi:hypothetical protein Nepgr_006675 [Nepenthes gracilis]|uniref:Uncharacterized protein n=1 Tax=Nepenthes gracilis TaxID=150966 RepID=A0AAD3S5W8_NEPGR|nr:hypothetical protein Nepgr_006675 [Nepenthes gracilis]
MWKVRLWPFSGIKNPAVGWQLGESVLLWTNWKSDVSSFVVLVSGGLGLMMEWLWDKFAIVIHPQYWSAVFPALDAVGHGENRP